MIISCISSSCSLPVKYYCKCNAKETFMCPAHTAEHLDEDDKAEHLLKSLYKTVTPEKKAFVLEQCAIAEEEYKELELSITNSFQDVINTLIEQKTELVKFFREQREFVKVIVEKINNENKEIALTGFEVPETYKPNCISLLKVIANQISKDKKNFENIIKNYSKEIQACKKIFGEFLDFEGNANLDEHLYGFKNSTKTFIEFNTLTLSINKREIDVDMNQGYLASLCQIPDKKFFYLGGNTTHNCSAYIIDLKTFRAERITKTKDRLKATATYYNDFIYIFGGSYSNSYLNNCEKYSLSKKEWRNITDFPESDRNCVCALPCKDFFILSSNNRSKLYRYNISADSYNSLSSAVENSSGNILFKNSNKYYYISANSFFTSTEENINKWVKSPKNLSLELSINTSKPITRGKFVYIMLTYINKVYKFDLEIEDLLEVTSF